MRRGWRGRHVLIAGSVLAVLSIAPVLVTMAAGGVARLLGCRLDEGDVYPCRLGGVDLGRMLYAMGEAFWLGLATILLAPAAALLVLIGVLLWWRERRPRAPGR